MPKKPPTLTDQEARSVLAAWERCGYSVTEYAEKNDMSARWAHYRVKAAKLQLGMPIAGISPALTPDRFVTGKTTVQFGPDGTVEREWRRMHPLAESLKEFADALVEQVERAAPPAPVRPKGVKVGGGKRLLEVPVFDLHIGKYAWAKEVGEDYDCDKAAKLLTGAVRIAATQNQFDEAVLVLGGDFFHVDNRHNVTERGGHQQDVDSRQARVWDYAVRAIIDSVSMLSRHNHNNSWTTVHIVTIPGNHDWESMYHLQRLLAAYYRNDNAVRVKVTPSPRCYHKHGTVLLGWAHGHQIPMDQLGLVMAQERAEDWAATTERVWHLGHIHKRKGIKYLSNDGYQGVSVEHLETLAGTDAWHHEQGYVGQPRRLEAFLWDSTSGLIARTYANAKDILHDK